MKSKIEQYVNHYFRFDKRDGLESLKEEIIGNLCDRYDAGIQSGLNEQDAYLSAVKSMGDFNAPSIDSTENTSVLPGVPEYLLPVSAILAVFAFILIFLNGIVGGVLTAISIAMYAVGGYYLYSKAMVVKSKELDIELHNHYLKRIFTYMKTSFFFWSVNIAFMISLLIQMISNGIVVLMKFNLTPDLNRIQATIQTFVVISIFAFVVSFIVLMILSEHLYHRLKVKYYLLTGEKELKGKIKSSYEFIQNLEIPQKRDLRLLFSYIFGLGSIGIYLLTFVSYERQVDNVWLYSIEARQFIMIFDLLNYEFVPAMVMLIGYLWVAITYILVLKFKKSKHLIFQSYIVLFITLYIFVRMIDDLSIMIDQGMAPIFILIPAVLSVIYYLVVGVQYIYQRKKIKKA